MEKENDTEMLYKQVQVLLFALLGLSYFFYFNINLKTKKSPTYSRTMLMLFLWVIGIITRSYLVTFPTRSPFESSIDRVFICFRPLTPTPFVLLAVIFLAHSSELRLSSGFTIVP